MGVTKIYSIMPDFTLQNLHEEFQTERDKARFAFVLGNGINRYYNGANAVSWENLMKKLWSKAGLCESFPEIEQGLSLVEKYDIMCVKMPDKWEDILKSNQELVKETFSQERFLDPFQGQLLKLNVPVLTTNYDNYLENGLKKMCFKNDVLYKSKGYSETYPLGEYYATQKFMSEEDIYKNFAVWHIHGTINHTRSLRLGTADYMGLLTYVRDYLKDEANMYNVTKEHQEWGIKDNARNKNEKYQPTWLNIFYNCSLCINGLGLEPTETFLRWLLISRKKYLDRIGSDAKGWYICSLKDLDEGKMYFLQNVGFKIVIIENFDVRYRELFAF